MRALVQRVAWAQVEVDASVVGRIDGGLLVYTAVAPSDTADDAAALAEKIVNLRVFGDSEGKLNLSIRDARGGVLAVSNFTLLADARKGRRPAFTGAAPAEIAQGLHEAFVAALKQSGVPVAQGVFGAHMIVSSAADGPVNVLIEMPPGQ